MTTWKVKRSSHTYMVKDSKGRLIGGYYGAKGAKDKALRYSRETGRKAYVTCLVTSTYKKR